MSAFKVQVFLSTYNGEKYIRQQIDSLLYQKDVQISILVRDDGSKDGTVKILEDYQKAGKISYYIGDNLGYARSFLDLVKSDVQADFYAFCDQDDVWLPDKVISGIKKLKEIGSEETQPMLYASALQRVDADLKPLAIQNFPNLKLTLGAEFVRHRLAGCTYIFNNMLRNLLKSADGRIASHDTMTAILCLACGGKFIFDDSSYILFRRHGDNTSSDGVNLFNKIKRTMAFYWDGHSKRPQLARFLLSSYKKKLTPEAIDFLNEIAFYKESLSKTVRLALSSNIDCGFGFYNNFVRIMILLRLY